ncbi:hypothetical protein Hanom_Chr09g00824101 [Helianthus anomalus]
MFKSVLLPYNCHIIFFLLHCTTPREGFYKWEDQHSSHVSPHGGKAICISACDDHQYSADTSVSNAIGALTYSFTNAVKSARNLTYGDLLGGLVNPTKEMRLVFDIFGTISPKNH